MTWMRRSEGFTGEVGRTYRVEWDDCCTTGWFISTLLEIREGEPDEHGDRYIDVLVFKHGEVTDGHVTLTEVPAP